MVKDSVGVTVSVGVGVPVGVGVLVGIVVGSMVGVRVIVGEGKATIPKLAVVSKLSDAIVIGLVVVATNPSGKVSVTVYTPLERLVKE